MPHLGGRYYTSCFMYAFKIGGGICTGFGLCGGEDLRGVRIGIVARMSGGSMKVPGGSLVCGGNSEVL